MSQSNALKMRAEIMVGMSAQRLRSWEGGAGFLIDCDLKAVHPGGDPARGGSLERPGEAGDELPVEAVRGEGKLGGERQGELVLGAPDV